MSVVLKVIGSGSSGNGYAVDAGDEILLIEAGVRAKQMSTIIGHRDDKIVGCLVSHVHGDHCKYVRDYANRGIKIYCNHDVAEKKHFAYGQCVEMEEGKTMSAGGFRIVPFSVNHDVPNYGYVVYHKCMGTMLFATDTYMMSFIVKGVNHWLIEANYDDRILRKNVEDGNIDRWQAQRLMVSHMEIGNTIKYLEKCEAERSREVILCHLSERNADPDEFCKRTIAALGVPVYWARKGMNIALPF